MYGQASGGVYQSAETLEWFRAVDADNSGKISATELQQALTNSDWSTFTLEACSIMIKLFDKSNTGMIGLDEFQALMQYIQQWRNAFTQYDSDQSGLIEQRELEQALVLMGYRLSPQFVAMVIAKYDPKGHRTISMDNFIALCVKLSMYTDAFKRKDTQMTGNVSLSYEDLLSIVFEIL